MRSRLFPERGAITCARSTGRSITSRNRIENTRTWSSSALFSGRLSPRRRRACGRRMRASPWFKSRWRANGTRRIAKVELLTPYVIEEAVAEVTLSLSGEAPAGQGKREVQFAIDGQPPMTRTIEPPAQRAEFRWKPESEGIVRGVASVASDDAFPEDNRRPFVHAPGASETRARSAKRQSPHAL